MIRDPQTIFLPIAANPPQALDLLADTLADADLDLMTTPKPDWITPEELAEQMERPVRWVKEKMADGSLPSVKVGGRRYWTPGCMAELERRQLHQERDPELQWGRVTRGRRAS